MSGNIKRYIFSGVLIVLITIVSFMFGGKTVDRVAEVNGVSISQNEFDQEYNMILNYYETTARQLSQKEKKGLREEVLARLVDKVIVLQEAKNRNIVITNHEVSKYIQDKFKGNDSLLNEYLSDRRLTLEQYKIDVKYKKTREALYDLVTKNYNYEDKTVKFTKFLNDQKIKSDIKVFGEFNN